MKTVLDRIQKLDPKQLTFSSLGDVVLDLASSKIQFEDLLPKVEPGEDYGRNILTLDPIEVVLLRWPPGAESAIHHHAGFWGYVVVLSGRGKNVEYTFQDGILKEDHTTVATAGGLLDEPDGVIHKIVNASDSKELVTLHFYNPALENLDELKLFDIPTGRIGVLNEQASNASFNEPEEHFRSIDYKAFTYQSFEEANQGISHRIYPIIPKPEQDQIKEMIGAYYEEQAENYDHFDTRHVSRQKYNEKINSLITESLEKQDNTEQMLVLACGTGRRALGIREKSGQNYQITGVDLSEKMCQISSERGIRAVNSDWLHAEVESKFYDSATFLYAFGHVPTYDDRLQSLKKIYDALKPRGKLYLDVFNLNDRNEWGPKALRYFERSALHRFGYDKGDVFYKKMEGEAVAFLHYFTQEEIELLLKKAGFHVDVVSHVGYVYRSGEILGTNEGSLFVEASKN